MMDSKPAGAQANDVRGQIPGRIRNGTSKLGLSPFPQADPRLWKISLGSPPRRITLQHPVHSALAARDRRVHVAIDHVIESREDPLLQLPVPVRAERE